MLHEPNKENDSSCGDSRTKPIKFLSNLFRKKKLETVGNVSDRGILPCVHVVRIPSTLSVKEVMIAGGPSSPATPARHRDIDADMEALRISRHDNPFLKQVLASRESLADSLEELESDDTTLMSQEFLGDLETDPLSLPEVHEHMIRSPPPTSWPRSPNFKMFRFDSDQNSSQDSLCRSKSPVPQCLSPRNEYRLDYQIHDEGSKSTSLVLSPKISIPRSHQRSSTDVRDRNFTLLTPAPLRSLTDVRRMRTSEDSQYLVPSDQYNS